MACMSAEVGTYMKLQLGESAWGELPAQLIICTNVVMVVQDQFQHLAVNNVDW